MAPSWGGGGGQKDRGAITHLNTSKKGKMGKYGVFLCIKVIKISFSVIDNKDIHALLRVSILILL